MNLNKIEPRETAGSSTQARYSFQAEYTAYQCIQLLDNPELVEVSCDFHSDCFVKDNRDFIIFYQVKGIKNRLFTVSEIKKAIPDMFSNYVTAQGKCKSILVTNASIGRKLKKIMKYKDNKHRNVINDEELIILNKIKNEWRKLVKDPLNLFDKFFYEFEIESEIPSFSESKKTNKMTLRDFNIRELKAVLDRTLNNNYSLEDVSHIYDMIFAEVQLKSRLTTRYDRTITKKDLMKLIQIPSSQMMLFEKTFTEDEINKIKDQSILEGKLEKGGFSRHFIKNAKLVRCVSRYYREKASKFKSNRNLINDFEYRLNNICLDVFEKHSRKEKYNSMEMLQEIEEKLIELSEKDKYEKLKFDSDFVRGLIWEATSQCKFRWDHEKK